MWLRNLYVRLVVYDEAIPAAVVDFDAAVLLMLDFFRVL